MTDEELCALKRAAEEYGKDPAIQKRCRLMRESFARGEIEGLTATQLEERFARPGRGVILVHRRTK